MSQKDDVRNPSAQYYQIGVRRPALQVDDLPTPEEVFKVKRIGLEELFLLVLGPGVIALGLAIGSGEWLLGPLVVGGHGFKGIGWVIMVSAVLQTFYNVELARFTIATGEPPVVAFGRTPPGFFFWVPLSLICFYAAFILGGWTVNAGASLFALFSGRPYVACRAGNSAHIGYRSVGKHIPFCIVRAKDRKNSRDCNGRFSDLHPHRPCAGHFDRGTAGLFRRGARVAGHRRPRLQKGPIRRF